MLSRFLLDDKTPASDFSESLEKFTDALVQRKLVESSSPLGQRVHHPVMDTDDSPSNEYFFVMSFADREQCDRAVEVIFETEKPLDDLHQSVLSVIQDPVFTCWQDL